VLIGLSCDRKLLGNGPHASREFTGNGDGDDVRMGASCHKLAVSLAQPALGFPADVLDNLGAFFESQLPMSADLGGSAVGPGAFHERPSGLGVANCGARALVASLSGGLC